MESRGQSWQRVRQLPMCGGAAVSVSTMCRKLTWVVARRDDLAMMEKVEMVVMDEATKHKRGDAKLAEAENPDAEWILSAEKMSPRLNMI